MPLDYLHNHKEFRELLRIVADDKSINPAFVEKDYWIMHCLYGLQQLNMSFELKGGTSLSKGYGLIDRFSEDIDIRIEPPANLKVVTNSNNDKSAACESRGKFYDWLANNIHINGFENIVRDTTFDDDKFRSGGIRLHYKSANQLRDLKDGILLEVGFDTVNPNQPIDISSWAYDHAIKTISIIDNRAKAVACYHPGYTLVEKLQTISTKFRCQQKDSHFPPNFMRHYYDVYRLLMNDTVLTFMGTDAYYQHKEKRFRESDNKNITKNEAFQLSDPAVRATYAEAYKKSGALYYNGQPDFDEVLQLIQQHAEKLS